MRSRWNLPIYVIYIIGCCVVISFILSQIGIAVPWANPYRVTATFHTGDGILVNNEVFMNGTKVGKVSDVKAVRGQAQVQLIIDDAHAMPLYKDAMAEVRKKNLLGETYVEVSRGHTDAGKMDSGGQIPVQHTLQTVQIDEVLAILDPQSRDRLKLLINGAGDATANRGTDMNDQAHSLNLLSQSLNGPALELKARRQQIDEIVLELQAFYTVLARQRDQVRDEFATWNDVMTQLGAQDTAIIGTVQQADTLLTNLDTLLQGSTPDRIRQTLAALPPALSSTQSFLDQSNDILGGLAPYRRSIHDVFPDLGTSFQDTSASGQHLWSVFSVSDCNANSQAAQGCPPATHPTATSSSGGSTTSLSTGAPNATWASILGGQG